MKIQYLSIIFVIIILPVIIITSVYNRMQINTIQLQRDYDAKLLDATYSAIKAYQINTANNEFSRVNESKRRDIEAAIETFMTSLSTGLGVSGYGTSYIQPYIPAILFTLYDGYYIYAPTDNDGTIEHMLKSFVTYSQRYVHGNSIDVVISYTLDNYVTIYGRIGTEYVNRSGYLNYYLLNSNPSAQAEQLSEKLFITAETFASYTDTFAYTVDENGQQVYYDEAAGLWFTYSGNEMIQYLNTTYNRIDGQAILTISGIRYGFDGNRIEEENYVDGFIKEYPYFYQNKQKTYYDAETQRYFTYLDATKRYIGSSGVQYNGDASYANYLAESKEFTQWVVDNLNQLMISDARSVGNEQIPIFQGDNTRFLDINQYNMPEESTSLFNGHKREIIRISIEENLTSAINNYNKHSEALSTTYNFRMPVIQENEWDRILSNVSLVTFVQGLPVGFKTYNNYAIVTSGTNQEYVTEDSMYFINPSGTNYHRIGCTLLDMSQPVIGYRNSDFDRAKANVRAMNGSEEQQVYYYKHSQLPCYYCIVNRLASRMRNIFDVNSADYNWQEAQTRRNEYYKALGRERYNVVN